MLYDVKKYLFVGYRKDKTDFFKRAQEAGFIHFIDLDPAKLKETPERLQDILKAIKILRGLPPVEQEEVQDFSKADPIVDRILQLKHILEKLEEEERVILLDISRIEVFGNFSLEDVAFIKEWGNRVIQFFGARQGFVDKMEPNDSLIYIGSEHGLDYFVGINPTAQSYEGMVEIKIDRSLETLKKRLIEIKKDHRKAEVELKTYAKYNHYLHQVLVNKSNTYNLENAEKSVLTGLDGSLFVAAGFVPENKISSLGSIAEKNAVYMEEVAIEPEDPVPTYIENEGMARLGQDLISIYDTPATTDKDPSLWVLFFFSLFFAFIVGDGGYGAVFLGFALYLRYRYPKLKGFKKRLLNLITFVCVACIIWGITISSFFGISLNPDNPFRKLSLIHVLATKKAEYHIKAQDKSYRDVIKRMPQLKGVKDPQQFLNEGYTIKDGKKTYSLLTEYSEAILLELALFLGVLHLSLSLLRNLKRHWSAIGWIAFLIGGYLYFPYYLGVPSLLNYAFGIPFAQGAQAGLQLMAIGVPLAVILAVVKHGVLGLTEATAVIQVFADTLSYLRLYALGLAGAIMASTINQMAETIPFVFAIILIVIAHLINMLLGVVSGLIHGLRLNFLEWYRYSFEGGGRKFKPLELKNLE